MKNKFLKILLIFALIISFSCDKNDDQQNTFQFLGEIEWAKTLGGTQEDFAQSVIQTSDGNLLVFGTTGSIDGDITDKLTEQNDYWLTKMDLESNVIWSKTYGGSDDDVGQDVIELNEGGFAIVGYSKSNDGDASNNEGFHDNWLLKLDTSGNIIWEKSFGFAGHDHAYSVVQTSDGGFFMTGFLDVTSSGGEGSTRSSARHGVGEFWCHKLDANGDIEWRKYFGGSNNDRSYDFALANDGGYVITGFSESTDFDITNSHGSYDYWVIKLDSQGTLLWEKSIGGTEIDQSRAIAKTEDNAYIIVGNSFSTDGDISSSYGDSDFFLVKLSDNGEIIWKKNYGGSDFDFATSINTISEGYIVSGYSQSNNHDLLTNYGGNDYWTIKINNQGELLWGKSFGGSGLDLAFDAIETSDGKIIVVGETESNDNDIIENKGLKDILVIKIE